MHAMINNNIYITHPFTIRAEVTMEYQMVRFVNGTNHFSGMVSQMNIKGFLAEIGKEQNENEKKLAWAIV